MPAFALSAPSRGEAKRQPQRRVERQLLFGIQAAQVLDQLTGPNRVQILRVGNRGAVQAIVFVDGDLGRAPAATDW